MQICRSLNLYLCDLCYCQDFAPTPYICPRFPPRSYLFRPFGPNPDLCRPHRARLLTFAGALRLLLTFLGTARRQCGEAAQRVCAAGPYEQYICRPGWPPKQYLCRPSEPTENLIHLPNNIWRCYPYSIRARRGLFLYPGASLE